MNQIPDDEIDLFELFQTLWDGKWLISAFVTLAVLFGCAILVIKDSVYHAKLIYFSNVLPPFYKTLDHKVTDKPFTDFQKMFYSANLFEDWKKVSGNTSIAFKDFSATKIVDGFIVTNTKSIATFEYKKKNNKTFILIKSKELPILDAFFKYSQYINDIIRIKYKLEAINSLSIIDKKSSGNKSESASIELFLFQISQGEQIFTINRPTEPTNVSLNKYLVMITSSLFGGVIGSFFVLIRQNIRKRKQP